MVKKLSLNILWLLCLCPGLGLAQQPVNVPEFVRQHVPVEFCYALEVSSMRLEDGYKFDTLSIPLCVNLAGIYSRDHISCSGNFCILQPTRPVDDLRLKVSTSRVSFMTRGKPIEMRIFVDSDQAGRLHLEMMAHAVWNKRLQQILTAHDDELPFSSDTLVLDETSRDMKYFNMGMAISLDSSQDRLLTASWFDDISGLSFDENGHEIDLLIRSRFLEIRYSE